MYLKGLELYGFKSFPKKTKLAFVPGVMAIVGPNGCGKSNLMDAVRWALGEQRTSVLRSDKMENVIFAGSAAQKPMHLAEVALTIENSHGILPEEYSEVSVTRRLHRTGESEYLINRRPVRLKDVRTLFADTGLGPESYSIIELKMVEDILSAKPEERRRLFEEAAGVTLYKARLRQTRQRLAATQADMVRLDDLLREVTTQRNSLRRQVAKARRYRYLRDALRVKEITSAAQELAELRAKVAPLEERANRDRKQREELEGVLGKADDELSSLRGRVAVLEEKLAALRKEREELEVRNQTAQREMVMLEERLRSGLRRGEERDKEEEELLERRIEIAKLIEELDGKHEKAVARDEEIRLRVQTMDESWREHEEREGKVRGKRDAHEQARREAERSLAALESERQQIERRLEAIGTRLVQLEMDISDKDKSPDPAPLSVRLEQLRKALDKLEQTIEKLRARRDEEREQRAQAESASAEASRDLEAAKRRVALFEGMVQGGEGRPKAVKALLTSGLKKLAGRLGDSIVVPDEWRLAVAAALEDVASAVIAEDRQGLRTAAAWLQEADRGRGLLASAEGGEERVPETPGFNGTAKSLGALTEKVTAKGKTGKVVNRFLSTVWLMKDLDAILEHADEARKLGWTLVAPDGSRLTPDGLLAVGRHDPGDLGAAGMLEEARKEFAAAENSLAKASNKAQALRERDEKTRGELEDALQQRQRASEEVEQARREYTAAETEAREREAVARRRAEEALELRQEQEQHHQRQAALEAELQVARAAVEDAEDAFKEIAAELETVEDEGRGLRSARDKLREQQVEASSAVERLQGEVRRQGALLDEIGRRLERIEQERKDATGALEDAGERLRHVQAEEAVLSRDLEQLSERLEELQREYGEKRGEYSEQDGALSEKRRELAEVSDRLHVTELEISDLKHRISSIRERILEDYEIDLLQAKQEELPLSIEEDNPYLEMPLAEVREKFRDLGPVNQMALEEYEIIDGRFNQLTVQHADLTKAIESLEETVREINTIARKRFMDTFTRVEGHFVGLFSRLFGGGEAALSLLDGDPLEAGIQIFASPKGKKTASIDLLSGGEKAMTAIALLFALYLERPSPFCFLDEVDAPLDDVNVVRFNRLLREFTDRTQFMVVTHNKLTMERADRLYGVTMEEEGVSRMVAVEIGKKEREKANA